MHIFTVRSKEKLSAEVVHLVWDFTISKYISSEEVTLSEENC